MTEGKLEIGLDPEIERMSQEVAQATPSVDWAIDVPDKQYGVVISLPHECSMAGTLIYHEDKTADLYINIFQVNPKLQGRGIGTRLMNALIREGLAFGATTISGHITSKSALKTRARVFGKDNLQFYTPIHAEAVDLSYDEALEKENIDFMVTSSLESFRGREESS